MDNITAAAFEAGVSPAVYYPATTNPSAATAIEVAPGATVLAIDLALARTRTFHVRGRINAQALAATPRVRVSIVPSESGTALLIPAIETASEDFDLPGVPPGRYHLSAQALPAPGERSAPLVITRVPVEVWDRDVEGVVALLQPGVTISGRILVDGAAPTSGQLPSIQLVGLNGSQGTGARRPAADGTFTIDNVATGDYRWRLLPFGGGLNSAPWAKTATFGADDVSKHVISVGSDAAGRRFEIDVSTRTSIIEAMVVGERQKPMAGVLVIAVPDPTRRVHSDAWRNAVTGDDGKVRFEGMVPGDYLFFATETIPAEGWQDPAVLKRHESKGLAVKLDQATRKLIVISVTS